MDQIKVRAYAKVNLGLDVIGRRENGYHDLRMIMQTVRLFDKLSFAKKETDEITIQTNLGFLPTNENNLIYKAIHLMKEEYGISTGVDVVLEKHIPVAAGMAGGSADCAAALYAMNKMFDLKLSRKTLMEHGVKLGADVPYCLMRGTALSEGIGEILTPLPPMPDCFIVVAKPPISVSTKYVYEHLNLDEISTHPDIDGMTEALKKKDLHTLTGKLSNVLETVTQEEYPVIQEIKKMMINEGALNAIMTGSGPTVFGIFEKKEDAERANDVIFQSGKARQVYTVQPFNVHHSKRKKKK